MATRLLRTTHAPNGTDRTDANYEQVSAMPIAVFDLDGTLVDTAPDLHASLNHCLSATGLPPVSLNAMRPHAGLGAMALLRFAYSGAGRPLDAAEADAVLARFLAFYEAHIADASRPFPGALDALSRLADNGFILAICTNKREHLAILLLETLDLADRFAAICGADTFSGHKPNPSHVLGTIKQAGGSTAGALMIGDTVTDTDAAKAAGIPSVLVDFGYSPNAEARHAADAVIAHYDELTPFLCRQLIAGHRRGAVDGWTMQSL